MGLPSWRMLYWSEFARLRNEDDNCGDTRADLRAQTERNAQSQGNSQLTAPPAVDIAPSSRPF